MFTTTIELEVKEKEGGDNGGDSLTMTTTRTTTMTVKQDERYLDAVGGGGRM